MHSETAFADAQRAGSSARMTVLVDTAKVLEAAESRTLTRIARGSCAALRQVSLHMRSGPAYENEIRYGARIRTTGFEKSTSRRSRMTGVNGAVSRTSAGPRLSLASSIRVTSRPVKVFGPTGVRTNMTADSVPSNIGMLVALPAMI